MRNLSKKAKTIIAGAAIAGLASAGGAYAYWTTTGSGTGAGSTTAGVANQLSFTQNPAGIPDTSVALTPMFPGDIAQPLTVRVRNTSSESAYVTSVGAYITTATSGCTGADFLIEGVSTGTNLAPTPLPWSAADLAAGAAANSVATLGVQFNNTGSNQNACKSAAVTLHYVGN